MTSEDTAIIIDSVDPNRIGAMVILDKASSKSGNTGAYVTVTSSPYPNVVGRSFWIQLYKLKLLSSNKDAKFLMKR